MGYYAIKLSPHIQYMTTSVIEFGAFMHNPLPMKMCALIYIFHVKVDELLDDI